MTDPTESELAMTILDASLGVPERLAAMASLRALILAVLQMPCCRSRRARPSQMRSCEEPGPSSLERLRLAPR
jgi:hypothetical protein